MSKFSNLSNKILNQLSVFFSSRKRQKVGKERKRGEFFPEKFIKGFVSYPKGYAPALRARAFGETPNALFNAPTQSRSDLRAACVYKWLSLWFFLPWRKNIKTFLIFPQIKPRCEATNHKSIYRCRAFPARLAELFWHTRRGYESRVSFN